MKILVQHIRSQLYLHSVGNWTMDPLDAFDFEHSQCAIDFARKHALTDVQIAIKFADSQYDEVFPLASLSPAVCELRA